MKPTGADIRAAVAHWQTALGLEDWVVSVKVGRMPGDTWGEAEVQTAYKRVTIRVYPKRMVEEGDTVDELCVHEISHLYCEDLAAYALSLCKTDAQRERVSQLEEQTVTDVSRAFQRLHKRPK